MSIWLVVTPVIFEFFLVSLFGAFFFVRLDTDFFKAPVSLISSAITTALPSVSRIIFHVVSVSEWFDLIVLLFLLSGWHDGRCIVIVIGVVISPSITWPCIGACVGWFFLWKRFVLYYCCHNVAYEHTNTPQSIPPVCWGSSICLELWHVHSSVLNCSLLFFATSASSYRIIYAPSFPASLYVPLSGS